MLLLSILPYCNAGWDVRVAGQERCAPPPPRMYRYDFPTLLSHPPRPRIDSPPPQAGASAKQKGDIPVSKPWLPLRERGWTEQISSGLLSRSLDVAAGAKGRVSVSPGSSRLGGWYLVLFLVQAPKVFPWVWEGSLPASKAQASKWKPWAAPQWCCFIGFEDLSSLLEISGHL